MFNTGRHCKTCPRPEEPLTWPSRFSTLNISRAGAFLDQGSWPRKLAGLSALNTLSK